MSGPDVMGREEVADALNVSVRRVGQLLDTDPAFPCVANGGAKKLARGLVFDGPAVRAYAKDRGRPDPKHTKVLQSYRKTGNIAQAARTAGCAVTTARRVLVDVGLLAPPAGRFERGDCDDCGALGVPIVDVSDNGFERCATCVQGQKDSLA